MSSYTISPYRYERKWIITNQNFDEVFISLKRSKLFFVSQHNDRNINSLYFDDSSLSTIHQKLDGINDKEKFRLRWYGDNKVLKDPKLEVKYKNGFLVKKKFIKVNELNNLKFFYNKNLEIIDRHINKVLNFKNKLEPILSTHYKRSYFISSNGLIRATLDRNLRSFLLTKNKDKNICKSYNEIILEVKYDLNLDTYVRNNLRNISVLLAKNSKYVNGAVNNADFFA